MTANAKKYTTLDLRLPHGKGYVITLDKSGKPVKGFFYTTTGVVIGDITNKNHYDHTEMLGVYHKVNGGTSKNLLALDIKRAILDLLEVGQGSYHPCLVRDCLKLGYDLNYIWSIRDDIKFAYMFAGIIDDVSDISDDDLDDDYDYDYDNLD